jgi:hypothetical protein
MPFRLTQLLVLILLQAVPRTPFAAGVQQGDHSIQITTEFTYEMGGSDSNRKSRAIALFGAKFEAVQLAAKYLTHKGLLEHYEKKQNEIFCLAANEIKSTAIDEKADQKTGTYYVKVTSEVTVIDFIKAEIKNLELEKKESGFTYNQEMGQPVSETINPGEELSRAYRYIRKEQWRIAIIYLDHLEGKYANWGDVHLAKAIAYYGMDDLDKMLMALNKACALNNQEACNELSSFTPKP